MKKTYGKLGTAVKVQKFQLFKFKINLTKLKTLNFTRRVNIKLQTQGKVYNDFLFTDIKIKFKAHPLNYKKTPFTSRKKEERKISSQQEKRI